MKEAMVNDASETLDIAMDTLTVEKDMAMAVKVKSRSTRDT